MNEHIIEMPVPLAQAIANYLMQRPYAEVAGFIDALQRLQSKEKPAPDVETSAEPK